MKRLLTILMLCGVVCGYAQNTPRYAASTKTWTFGEQTWSDAIHIPECNKNSFEESETAPACRSYTDGAETWYYYNWPYVSQHAATLCPSPWRVPARDDITALAGRDPKPDLQAEWGYGGYAYAYSTSVNDTGLRAYYWSSTEYNTGNAYSLYFDTSGNVYPQYYSYKYQGFRVRCVK